MKMHPRREMACRFLWMATLVVAQVGAFQPLGPVTSRATTRPSFASPLPTGDGEATLVVAKEDTKAAPKQPAAMPWSEFHHYALSDNLPKYTRTILVATGDSITTTSPRIYALWRTMLQEVPELTGYPISFLREQYSLPTTADSSDEQQDQSKSKTAPEVLPFLDHFYFEPSGGLSGQVSL